MKFAWKFLVEFFKNSAREQPIVHTADSVLYVAEPHYGSLPNLNRSVVAFPACQFDSARTLVCPHLGQVIPETESSSITGHGTPTTRMISPNLTSGRPSLIYNGHID